MRSFLLIICILIYLSYNVSSAGGLKSPVYPEQKNMKDEANPNQVTIYYMDRIRKFDYRARTKYLLLDNEDLSTIDLYYEILFKTKIQKEQLSIQSTVSFHKFFKIINFSLIQNKIPKNYLDKIRAMFVALNGFITINDNYFNQRSTLWLIEYRGLKDPIKADEFLFDLIKRDESQKEIVLKILRNDNKPQQIKIWFQEKTISNFSEIIEITRRQEKIIESFKINNKNAIDLLVKDYQFTIKQIFESYKPKNNYYHTQYLLFEHVEWIFLQLNIHKELPKIKDILFSLNEDFLIFNDDAIIENLPKDLILATFESIYQELGIFWKVGEINKLFLSPSFTSNYDNKLLKEYKYKFRNYVYNKIKKFL